MASATPTLALRTMLAPVLLAAGSGLTLGAAAGLAQARYHDYWAMGFVRNAALTLRGEMLEWLIIGATFGLAYAALSTLVQLGQRLMGASRRSESAPAVPPEAPHRSAALIASAALLLAPVLSELRWLTACVIGTLLCLYGGALARRAQDTLPIRLLGATARFAALALPALFLTHLLHGEALALSMSRELLVSVVVIVVVVGLTLSRSTSRGWGADPMSDARLGPSATLLVLLSVVAFLCGSVPGSLVAANPKNVLLILVDTLRADATSLNPPAPGTSTDPTPSLSDLRRSSTVFSTAISQAPWTLPATASILTGKYPGEHGARSFTSKLRDREHTLAELLTEAGYQTDAVISNTYLRRTYGLDQGFQNYDETLALDEWIFWNITSKDVTDRAIERLRAQEDAPFLLLAHYFDPHASFRDHDAFQQADAYRGWLHGPIHTQAELDLRINANRLGPQDVEYLRALYAEEISFTDQQVGRLLNELDSIGLAADTAVIFVSDHGEEFFERGWIGHTIHLSDEMVRVPLLFSLPGVEQVDAVHAPVETRSIFQTLLEYLQIESFEAPAGPSLLAAIRGAGTPPGIAFSEVRTSGEHTAWPARTALSAIRTADMKLIYQHIDGIYSLYDLVRDPREQVDVAHREPEELAALQAQLQAWMGSTAATQDDAPRELSDEAEKQLRALGYIE